MIYSKGNISIRIVVFIPLLFISGCDLSSIFESSTDKAIRAIDGAISKLGVESTNWQKILLDLEKTASNDVKAILGDSVNNLITRGVAATGSEIKCTADFVGNRMKQHLENVKRKILGQTKNSIIPKICAIVPASIDLGANDRPNILELHGYDFDLTDQLEVRLIDADGVGHDVTSLTNYPTHYLLTLKITGANSVEFNDKSKEIIFKLAGTEKRESIISTVAVSQPPPPPPPRECVAPTYTDLGYPAGRGSVDSSGDGCPDYCRVVGFKGSEFLSCSLGYREGSPQPNDVNSPPLDIGYGNYRFWVDVNGDRKADYCRVIGNNNDYKMNCTLSTGRTFGSDLLMKYKGENIDIGYGDRTKYWKDIDKDKIPDYCRVTGLLPKAKTMCLISDGRKFVSERKAP